MTALKKMLYEDDVVKSACAYLKSQGFKIIQRLNARQHGDDIVAQRNDGRVELRIEAKGETSSDSRTARYGNSFDRSQVRDHVANASYRAAKMSAGGGVSGIALPKNSHHEFFVGEIQHALDALQIIVFWVASDGSVTTSRPLP